VGARVSHFLLAPVLVARTDMVAAIDGRVADAFAGPLRLKRFPPPVPLPRGNVGQVWHEHHHTDPGHQWFRGLVRAVCQAP
jgi:DNA-binding transcriptional LysR family regulator